MLPRYYPGSVYQVKGLSLQSACMSKCGKLQSPHVNVAQVGYPRSPVGRIFRPHQTRHIGWAGWSNEVPHTAIVSALDSMMWRGGVRLILGSPEGPSPTDCRSFPSCQQYLACTRHLTLAQRVIEISALMSLANSDGIKIPLTRLYS